MAPLLDICISIILLTCSFASCDPIPRTELPPSEMSYDLEKKISVIQQEIPPRQELPLKEELPIGYDFDSEKKISFLQQVDSDKKLPKESYKLDKLQEYLQQQEEQSEKHLPSKQSYALSEMEKMKARIQYLEEMMNNCEEMPLSKIMQADDLSDATRFWPDGKYALQSTPSGCPSGWSEGWRYQDTEDSHGSNHWSHNLPNRVKGSYGNSNVKQYYCTKDDSVPNHGVKWPKGSYCIARYGGSCPEHFSSGSIYWDDEDSNNANEKYGKLPDGTYNRNTKIEYCCRNDVRPHVSITLPTDQPFILYRYRGTCQKVAGMRVAEEYLRFDCEDSDNNDSCSGDHPDDDSCRENHWIHYCYYY